MRYLNRLIVIIFIISTLLSVTQCTKLPGMSSSSNHPALNSPFTLPADAYLALAKNQAGDEQQALLIMAAGRLIEEGQLQQSQHILSKVRPVKQELINEKQILLAKIDLTQQHYSASISLLSHTNEISNLPIYYQAQYHELLATAYQSTQHYQEAIRERIKLHQILPDEGSKINNLRALWLSLTKLPLSD